MTLGWRTGSVDADVLHRECLGVAPHRVLTDEGLPKCLIVTAGSGNTAIATPRGHTASHRIDADGRLEPMVAWPAPIVGEVHGPAGQMAWSYTTPQQLLFRHDSSAGVIHADVTFQTYSAIWWQNRVVLTTSDGLWMWEPGREPTRVASMPPAVLVRLDGQRVEVDPLSIDAGRLSRRRLDRAWTVDLRDGTVVDRSLAVPGQRWSEHTRGRRTAVGFPQADAVSIQDAGVERWLVWPSPRAALWLGASLLLNTTSGDVAFVDLSGRLTS
jgi:hypothetical protein